MGLPKHLEQSEPTFHHTEAVDIPTWNDRDLQFKLIAGELFGHKSPVPVHSRLFFLEIKTKESCKLSIGKDLFGEVAMYVLEGTVRIDGNIFAGKQLLIAKSATLCEFEMSEYTTVYLFGGEPFEEERYIFWNFVNSDKESIEKAKLNWHEQNHDAFPLVPGDDEDFVPLPKAVLNGKLSK